MDGKRNAEIFLQIFQYIVFCTVNFSVKKLSIDFQQLLELGEGEGVEDVGG